MLGGRGEAGFWGKGNRQGELWVPFTGKLANAAWAALATAVAVSRTGAAHGKRDKEAKGTLRLWAPMPPLSRQAAAQ